MPLLRLLNLKTIATWGPWALLASLILFTWNQHETLKTERARLHAAETALQNPKVVEVIKVVHQTGPIRIIEKIVDKPTGERETTRETTTTGETVTEDSHSKKEPVAITALVDVAGRTNRWLLAGDLRDLNWKDYEAWTVYGGYGWANRFDLMLGASKRDRWESHIMTVIRF